MQAWLEHKSLNLVRLFSTTRVAAVAAASVAAAAVTAVSS